MDWQRRRILGNLIVSDARDPRLLPAAIDVVVVWSVPLAIWIIPIRWLLPCVLVVILCVRKGLRLVRLAVVALGILVISIVGVVARVLVVFIVLVPIGTLAVLLLLVVLLLILGMAGLALLVALLGISLLAGGCRGRTVVVVAVE